jgi:uncharacterized alkaline shock family protein YloU
MNTLNRVVVVLLLLFAMVLCSLAFIVPLRTLQTIAQQAGALADMLGRVRPVVRLPVGILLALIVDLVGILFIILEVRRPEVRSINVEQAAGGEVTLSVASIADQLKAELSQLPEIIQAKPKVSAKRKGVVVELDARIAAETEVPDKAERIVETIRRVVEQRMGLKLARPPKVNIEAVRRTSGARVDAVTRRVSDRPAPAPAESSGSQDTTSEKGALSG